MGVPRVGELHRKLWDVHGDQVLQGPPLWLFPSTFCCVCTMQTAANAWRVHRHGGLEVPRMGTLLGNVPALHKRALLRRFT